MDVRSDIYSLGCTLWYLLTGKAPFAGSLASVFAQHLGSEPPWEKLRPFPKRIRRLLRRMLQKEPSQRPASAVELRREIEQCLDDVERREALAARIARPFNIGRQWLTASPRSRGAVICSVSLIGLILAFAYNENNGLPPASAPPAQTSGVVPAQDSANSNAWFARINPGWFYLGTWDEPFWSLALARRASFAETAAHHPGVIGAKSWLPEDDVWDAEVVEPFAVRHDSRSEEEDPFSPPIALDKSFSVGDSENEKVAIRDKDEVEKTAKRSVKKSQRRVTSTDRDREFSPLREIRRAREKIRREIRRIL